MKHKKISTFSTVLLVALLSAAMLLTACKGAEPQADDGGITTFSSDGETDGTFSFDGEKTENTNLGEDYVIQWVDPAFENLIRQTLNKPSGDLHRSDLDGFTWFTIVGPYFVESNLTEASGETPSSSASGDGVGLDLYSDEWYELDGEKRTELGEITRLDDLVHFKRLFSVRIQFNKISDISALEACPWLEDVFLSKNEITDLSALSDLIKLRWLNLADNKISDLTPISGLSALEMIDLGGNQISDVSALKNLKNLQIVVLSRNRLVNLAGVSGLPKLVDLWAGMNQINDLSALKDLPALEMIDLEQNNISDLRSLASLEKLRAISLIDNPVTDWSPVANVPNVDGRP